MSASAIGLIVIDLQKRRLWPSSGRGLQPRHGLDISGVSHLNPQNACDLVVAHHERARCNACAEAIALASDLSIETLTATNPTGRSAGQSTAIKTAPYWRERPLPAAPGLL